MMTSTVPFITIVMPVRNEVRFIKDTLMQLLHQEYPADRFEIIVADGMSDDGTAEVAKKVAQDHPNVKVMVNEKRLSSAGRNIGFRNGRGDIFLVIDGHCYIESTQFLKNVVSCFATSGADCLGRPQPLDPPGLTDFQKAVALARASSIGHSGDSLIYSTYEGYASPVSNGASYKREVFTKVGYVDERFDACEDVEFNYRVKQAGLRAYTSPLLTVKYYPRSSFGSLYRQMKRYGQGRFCLLSKHPDSLTVNTMVPPLFAGGLFALMTAALSSVLLPSATAVLIVLGVLYGVYAGLIAAVSLRIALREGLHYFRYLPLIFFAIHFGLGVGFLSEMVRWNKGAPCFMKRTTCTD
ncbi:MAG: glycosyltransferase family 2 protein [Nitrospirota bacterium]